MSGRSTAAPVMSTSANLQPHSKTATMTMASTGSFRSFVPLWLPTDCEMAYLALPRFLGLPDALMALQLPMPPSAVPRASLDIAN